mmetsp:Transcript_20068/g.43788  ORF Transcript_20068/g.43788 Transcript_20068/m.43788 type:complete len:127 (+) Transcript_20068:81-461(+)
MYEHFRRWKIGQAGLGRGLKALNELLGKSFRALGKMCTQGSGLGSSRSDPSRHQEALGSKVDASLAADPAKSRGHRRTCIVFCPAEGPVLPKLKRGGRLPIPRWRAGAAQRQRPRVPAAAERTPPG